MKKAVVLIVVFCIVLFSFNQFVEAAGPSIEPSLIVLGEVLDIKDLPIIEDGKVYVPVRAISEALGYKVDYNLKTKLLNITKGDFSIKMTIDNKTVNVNGNNVLLEKAPFLRNGRAYVPISFVYQGFCISADYNKKTNTIKVGCLNTLNENANIGSKGAIYILGKRVDSEFSPLIHNSNVMVPIRPLGEGLGYDITWDINSQTMELIKRDNKMTFLINSDKAIIDKKEVKMGVKTIMVEGRAYIPFSFLESTMGYSFKYNKEENSLLINEKKETEKVSRIQDISYSEESGYPQLLISADNPMEFDTFTLDKPNRMVIDVSNAIADTDFMVREINKGEITRVRIGQFSSEPKIARIVVDLENHKKAKVTSSQDKKNISLIYANIIQPVTVAKEGYSEVITIRGSQPIDSTLFSLENPDRIVIDVGQAVLGEAEQNISINNSPIVKSVRTGQFDIATARIVVDLGKPAFFDVKKEGLATKVYISDIPSTFLGYDKYYNSSYITLSPGEDVRYNTNFNKNDRLLKIELDKDIKHEKDMYKIDDNLLEYIKLSKSNKSKNASTLIEFKLKEKTDYELLETMDNKLIKLKLQHRPLCPDDVLIIIDAGHGGKDPGAKAVDGSYEKTYNLDVAKRLDRNLKELGFRTLMTREDDVYTTLQERADAANWNYADFFVSIHFNAYMNKTVGIETLYYPNTPSEVYNVDNKMIASIFQEEILKALKRPSRGVIARPDLFVLNKTKMPAILMELGFLTNKEELSFIKKEEYREDAAKALTISLIRYYKEIRGLDFNLHLAESQKSDKENIVKR